MKPGFYLDCTNEIAIRYPSGVWELCIQVGMDVKYFMSADLKSSSNRDARFDWDKWAHDKQWPYLGAL